MLERCAGGTLPSLDVAGSLLPGVPAGGSAPPGGAANPAGPVGPVVAGVSDGPCETLSPIYHKHLDPSEHSVLDHAGPAGWHIAVGPVGPFRTLSSSDCHPGLAGPYVAEGPVGPVDSFKVLELLEHSVRDHADPAGDFSHCRPSNRLGCQVLGFVWDMSRQALSSMRTPEISIFPDESHP